MRVKRFITGLRRAVRRQFYFHPDISLYDRITRTRWNGIDPETVLAVVNRMQQEGHTREEAIAYGEGWLAVWAKCHMRQSPYPYP